MTENDFENVKETKHNSIDQIKKELKEATKREKEEQREQKKQEKISKYPEWMKDLQFDNFGNLKRSLTNYTGLLTKCDDIGQFKYDVYTKRRIYTDTTGKESEFSDSLYREFFKWTEQYISPCDEKKCIDAMMYISDQNSYNSATNLLDNLIWDGVPRLDTFFIDILGADDHPIIRSMTRQWMVGAVQRLYNPGCKNENVLILTGCQGCGKTSTLMWLAGDLGFDNTIDISRSEQETGQKLERCWFACFDELATLSKRQSAEYKNWLSVQTDVFRQPYERVPEHHNRHNVYCGTTNESTFLRDDTDRVERRMWVINCKRTQQEWKDQYYDKLTDELWENIWSEATYIYKNDPKFNPYISSAMYEDFINHQKQFKKYDSDMTELLIEYLDKPYYLDEKGNFASVDDMLKQMKGVEQTYRSNTSLQYLNHIQYSYVSKIYIDLLHQKKCDHNCLRNVLDGQWCLKKNRCRIGGVNSYFYIRGKWQDIENDNIEREFKVYENTQSSQSIDDMKFEVDCLFNNNTATNNQYVS